MKKNLQNNVFTKNFYEKSAWKANKTVCGIDEVGRGCLAGPLVTTAVIIPCNKTHSLLKDSKTLSQKELLTAYRWITGHCKYCIGVTSNVSIDKRNIYNATLISMKRTLMNLLATLHENPQIILIDAMPLKITDTAYKNITVHHFCKGENKSTSIAAASIVAKVWRDQLMGKFEALFPGYYLKDHKGYGTKKHKDAIDQQKHTIIHRKSFLTKYFKSDGECEHEEQLSLF